MTALEFKPLTQKVLKARAELVRQAAIDAGWPVQDGPPLVSMLLCNGCSRHLDLAVDEPTGWSTARADEPAQLATELGQIEIEGWVDYCAMCKLRHRLDAFRIAIRGSPRP